MVVGDGCLIDEPDLDGVVDRAVFVVDDADDHGSVFLDSEVPWVSFCFPGGSEEVEFSEFLPGFGEDDNIDKRRDDDKDDDYKNDGEGSVDFVFLFREPHRKRDDESFLWICLLPSIDTIESDADNEDEKGEEDGFKSDPPGGVVQH